MALNPGVVDVYLRALDQTPGERSGPTGRLTNVVNGVVEHYNPGRGQPQRVKVSQRLGFSTMPITGHSSTTGVTETIGWTDPELLATIGSQLLSIDNAVPKVWDGTDWTNYGAERVVPNRLSEEVFHTSQRTIFVPDHAWSGGVTCSVWSEVTSLPTMTTVLYVGFRDDNGAWVRTPQVLYDPALTTDDIVPLAKVIADAEGEYFWVVHSMLVADMSSFRAVLFDLNGRQINNHFFANNAEGADITNTAWDITQLGRGPDDGGCYHVQPLFGASEADDGATFTSLTQVAGAISGSSTVNTAINCRGKLAWMTNDLADGNWYLATMGESSEPAGRLWGYQIVPPDADPFGHEYDFNIDISEDTTVDSLIGFVQANNNPDNLDGIPDMVVRVQLLMIEAETVGPTFDPQLRHSKVWRCDFVDTVTFIRQDNSTCVVSRAFLHDDEYYGIHYFQSGSGNVITSTVVEVDFTGGDYMLGAPTQPIEVVSGDYTTGATKTYTAQNFITNSVSGGTSNVAAGDTVSIVISDGTTPNSLGFVYAPVGTPMLRWEIADPFSPNNLGGTLEVTGTTGVAGANQIWQVIGPDDGSGGTVLYTKMTGSLGLTLTPGTFNTAGTAEKHSQTFYRISGIADDYTPDTKDFLIGGEALISGNTTGANNGTKTIVRVGVETQYAIDDSRYGETGIWIATGSEVNSNDPFTAALTPDDPNIWFFSQETFDTSYDDAHLVVTGDEFPENNINLPISDGAFNTHAIEVNEGTAVRAEVWQSDFPSVMVELQPDQTPWTFFLQDVDPDYSFIGALIVVSGDTVHPENNGTYRIVSIDPDPDNHIVYAEPADGTSDQRNQNFIADDQSINIIFQTNVNPSFQPCWLMIPLTGTKPVVGRWEYGIAYADWRFEGGATFAPSAYPCAVSSPVRSEDAWLFMLPYRAVSFTVGQTISSAAGSVVSDVAINTLQSTVGLKQFTMSDEPGLASNASTAMLLPGMMCGEFTDSGFHENGVNFGFEAPFIVSQGTSSSGFGLRPGGRYQIVVVAEVMDESGDRVFSIPSPPLNFTMTGTNNSVVYGGRMLQPLGTTGAPVVQHFGVTNYKLLGISIYRTAYQDNVPTTEHHKITLDLNVNGLAPVSATNDSGFAFAEEHTWRYTDENLDAQILPAEVLYTDKGYLPRVPAPAQRSGVFWKNRSWVIGYDGAIWMSGEKKEGDATWFFPGFRFVLPTTDKPVALSEMDDFLMVICQASVWFIPATTFPDSTGRGGTLPPVAQTPFTNGGTGFAKTLRTGVAYSSTAGGVWLITRGQDNSWLSQPIRDSLPESINVSAMAVDKRQRLMVAARTGEIYVYDQVVQMWYRWFLPTSDVRFLAILDGQCAFREGNKVWLQSLVNYADNFAGSPVGVAMDITIASLNFANVRGLKSVWEMQVVGNYKGEHHLNAVLSYPDDDPANPTLFGPYTPSASAPYLLAINPMIEQASSYGLRIYTDFSGIADPGNSCEIELVSCEVGVDSSVGLNKFVNSRRIEGT